MTDKKYRECMAEIIGVLKKHDLGGTILVCSKERIMFKHHFPTWSVVQFEGPGGVRIRSKREDFPSREAQKEAAEWSAKLVFSARDMAAQTFNMYDAIAKKMEAAWDVQDKPFTDFDPETSH